MRARRGRWAAVLLAAAGGIAGLVPASSATAGPAWAFVAPVKIIERAGPRHFDSRPRSPRSRSTTRSSGRTRSDQKHTRHVRLGRRFDYEFGTKGATEERRFQRRRRRTPTTAGIHDGMTGTIVVEDPTHLPRRRPRPPRRRRPRRPGPPPRPPRPRRRRPRPRRRRPTTTPPSRPPARGAAARPSRATAAAPPPTLATSSTTGRRRPRRPRPPRRRRPPRSRNRAGTRSPRPPRRPRHRRRPSDHRRRPKSAAGRPVSSDGELDPGAVALVVLLVAVGLFGAWTLIRVRPGRI